LKSQEGEIICKMLTKEVSLGPGLKLLPEYDFDAFYILQTIP
jgi:hypothetical protein